MSNKEVFVKKAINDSIEVIKPKPKARPKTQVKPPLSQKERDAIAKRIEKREEDKKAYAESLETGSRVSPTAIAALKAMGLLSKK